MVHIAVLSLVGANGDDHIAQCRVFVQLPIINGDFWGSDVLVPTFIHLSQVLGVRNDRFFFKIANNPVCRARREQVEEEVGVVERELRDRDDHPLKQCRIGDVDEGHQVHPLILGFVEEGADPSLILTNMAKSREVLQQTADHARYGRDRLKNDSAVAITLGEKAVGDEAQHFDKTKGDLVAKALWQNVNVDGALGGGEGGRGLGHSEPVFFLRNPDIAMFS